MTIEPKYFELMNAALDGEISDVERAELARYLTANPEALAKQAELAELCQSLDKMEQVVPPPHLKYSILESMKPMLPVRPADSGWRQILAVPVLRHSVAFAAGAVLTFALISSNQISDHAFDDVTGLVGTMSEPAPPGARNNTIKLTSNEIAGTVSVRNDNSLKVIDFNLAAGGPVEIVARYANQRVTFRGFAQLEDDNASISISDGLVRMNMQGTNRYAMYLQHAGDVDARVNFQFFASGLLIHEADLVLRAAEGQEKPVN